jgi:hypothetical protein
VLCIARTIEWRVHQITQKRRGHGIECTEVLCAMLAVYDAIPLVKWRDSRAALMVDPR